MEMDLTHLQDISGLVMDVMGEPIVGVNVMEKGTTNGTITDMDGKFLLKYFCFKEYSI